MNPSHSSTSPHTHSRWLPQEISQASTPKKIPIPCPARVPKSDGPPILPSDTDCGCSCAENGVGDEEEVSIHEQYHLLAHAAQRAQREAGKHGAGTSTGIIPSFARIRIHGNAMPSRIHRPMIEFTIIVMGAWMSAFDALLHAGILDVCVCTCACVRRARACVRVCACMCPYSDLIDAVVLCHVRQPRPTQITTTAHLPSF